MPQGSTTSRVSQAFSGSVALFFGDYCVPSPYEKPGTPGMISYHFTPPALNPVTPGIRLESSDTVDASSLVEKILSASFIPWKDGRAVRLKITGRPGVVNIDPVSLGLLVRSLVDNACKYSEGKASPEVHCVFFASKWRLVVADYGIGIPKAELGNLLRPFSRASNAADIPGMGLGLVTASHIVQHCNGAMNIQSKEGEGTTITVEFPRYIGQHGGIFGLAG